MTPLETYLSDLHTNHPFGVKETAHYGRLETLLNDIGKNLKPRVRCIIHPQNQGAGIPDGGLFSQDQFTKLDVPNPIASTLPSRGVLEVKGTGEDVHAIAQDEQVLKYLKKYRQVLVTNYRDFLLVVLDDQGRPQALEGYQLAPTAEAFWKATAQYTKLAEEHEERLTEYLKRVMLQTAALATPKDVAWFLASYARDASNRIERAELPALKTVRTALEEALGLRFQGKKGEHFFRSTLIQTLFYGIFSAWVLWHKENPTRKDRFEWKTAEWRLKVPIIRALFEQVATPSKLTSLDLVEVLDWTGNALNRVDRRAFFASFEEAQAVQYFYEPFLQAFDPELRKDLGVWYTPPEIVKYMVERVDTVLRDELDIEDGLADPNVYVLDPCTGTGSYLVEVLCKIDETLRAKGEDALGGLDLKRAAMERVFGFEILPAPFVVAHLQLGLLLQNRGAPLSEKGNERVGVYLTNALTGWESAEGPKQHLLFPELEEERDAAEEVKREKPIIVILGNPPYNAFAGVSPQDEKGLVESYKRGLNTPKSKGGWGVRKFNLDDLYIRFFRLAERRIAEKTGKGVVCYISNFSYLSDPSFVVMRQRFLAEFDTFWFDSLNGDSRETGKRTPEGKPDPSVFSTQYNREGIRVGTAIGLMVRKNGRTDKPAVRYRQFWGASKRADLLESLDAPEFEAQYEPVEPDRANRHSLRPFNVTKDYLAWPQLEDLCAREPFNGPIERRGSALISIDRAPLASRIQAYFNKSVSDEQVEAIYPPLMMTGNRIVGPEARAKIVGEFQYDESRIVRYPFKPFDVRWCYLENLRPLFSEPSPQLLAQQFPGNQFLVVRETGVTNPTSPPMFMSSLVCDYHSLIVEAKHIPMRLRPSPPKKGPQQVEQQELFVGESSIDINPTANLSSPARAYLHALGVGNPDADCDAASLVWMHALAISYSPSYLIENADGLRQEWPHLPMPNHKQALFTSAQLGKRTAELLDTEQEVSGVTTGSLRPELQAIGLIRREGGGELNQGAGELQLKAGWGYAGQDGVSMPGKGTLVRREYTPEERTALEQGGKALGLTVDQMFALLGDSTLDIYLNQVAYWKNVPTEVWRYTIGGYQVMKKWLSYREIALLGRPLNEYEVREVRDMARRIAALLLLTPQFDANYQAVKGSAYLWMAASD